MLHFLRCLSQNGAALQSEKVFFYFLYSCTFIVMADTYTRVVLFFLHSYVFRSKEVNGDILSIVCLRQISMLFSGRLRSVVV